MITLMRVVLVPLVVFALLSEAWTAAFLLFLLAGLSDAIDGIVARAFDQVSEFGTLLDPIADKTLLVSVFIVLAYLGQVPLWFAILVVSRDLLIVTGIIIAFLLDRPIAIQPLWVSKATTTAQIVLALLVLELLAFEHSLPMVQYVLEVAAGVLTVLSGAAYMVQGIRHFAGEHDVPENESEGNL